MSLARGVLSRMAGEGLTDAQVAQTWHHMHAFADQLTTRGESEHLWPVADGSPLAGDDRGTTPWHLSHAVSVSLSAALDHLHSLTSSVVRESPVLHRNAPFSAARGCLDNAAVALWIVDPKRRSERITRALRWYAADFRDGDRAITDAGLTMPRALEARLEDLRATATTNGIQPKLALKGYTSTEALRYVDALLPDRVLFAWRLASGFSHGRAWAPLAMLENEPRPSSRSGVVRMRQTSSLDRVLYPALTGFNLLRLTIKTFESRAKNHLG